MPVPNIVILILIIVDLLAIQSSTDWSLVRPGGELPGHPPPPPLFCSNAIVHPDFLAMPAVVGKENCKGVSRIWGGGGASYPFKSELSFKILIRMNIPDPILSFYRIFIKKVKQVTRESMLFSLNEVSL